MSNQTILLIAFFIAQMAFVGTLVLCYFNPSFWWLPPLTLLFTSSVTMK